MCHIPQAVSDTETILRTIFSPANVNPNTNKIRSNLFKPQIAKADEDDNTIYSNKVSVTRYDYVDIEFCRSHAKRHSSPSKNRNYWGFAQLIVQDVRNFNVYVIAKPSKDNPAHANIVYPFKLYISNALKGVPLDSKTQKIIQDITEKANIFIDPNPNSPQWTGQSF